MTLSLALIIHAVIILGMTFSPADTITPRFEPLQVTLVTNSNIAPEDAKLLAQANLTGGGDSTEQDEPAMLDSPLPGTSIEEPELQSSLSPPPATDASPDIGTEQIQQSAAQKEQLLAADNNNMQQTTAADASTASDLTTQQAAQTAQENLTNSPPIPPIPPKPKVFTSLKNSLAIASLSARIREKIEKKAKMPRRKFISASTREYKYASYMETWRQKVERIGNLNYPEQALEQNITGTLMLDVAINTDGSIHRVIIRKSSGEKLLDNAAIRIVHMAAPFAPLPAQIKEDTDVLHITRSWQFLSTHGFRGGL